MTQQLALDQAPDARERALARVAAHTDPRVWQAAMDAVYALATERRVLDTDAVWERFQRYLWSHVSHEPRFLGAVMQAAKRKGWIASTGVYRPSKRAACHARPIMQWESREWRKA